MVVTGEATETVFVFVFAFVFVFVFVVYRSSVPAGDPVISVSCEKCLRLLLTNSLLSTAQCAMYLIGHGKRFGQLVRDKPPH